MIRTLTTEEIAAVAGGSNYNTNTTTQTNTSNNTVKAFYGDAYNSVSQTNVNVTLQQSPIRIRFSFED